MAEHINPIGIMQGRLSPPVPFRLQAFPTLTWETEFENAHSCGIDMIEWLFEDNDGRGHSYAENPMWSEDGRTAILRRIEETGVSVKTCCADYFMPHPFFRVKDSDRLESIAMLNRLILNSAQIGIETILVPVLETCEMRTPEEKKLLLESLKGPLELASERGVRLGLEMELEAEEYLELIEEVNHPFLGIYYDTGNHAAKGHDIAVDARQLGAKLVGVHIKDRKQGGTSVLLGQGDANFDGFFATIQDTDFAGPVILQTAFGEDYLGIAKRHRQFVSERLYKR